MSLEQALQENTAALIAHTAALTAANGAAPKAAATGKGKAADKAAAETKESKKEEAPGIDYETVVKPRVIAVVKAKGREVVDTLLADKFGGAKSAKELKADQYQQLLDELDAIESAEDDLA